VVHAPAALCYKLIPPGQCKRIMPAGPLVAYQWRCPCCKSLGLYSSDGWVEAGWAKTAWRGVVDEDSEEQVERTVEHPLVVSHALGFTCQGCGRAVSVRENVVTVS
jgi:hypothetical protein